MASVTVHCPRCQSEPPRESWRLN
ncbi:TPA: IS1 family transposase, partial [Escherichia coli]